MKSLLDIIGSGLLMVILSPLLVLLGLLVWLDSGSPLLFRQPRVGRGGKIFVMLKFRSLIQGQHLRKRTFTSLRLDQPVFHDPEVMHHATRIGRWLRVTGLDELPQLWNVFRGDMSVVGPRPVLPDDLVLYGDQVAKRCSVKPGLTGLYQVSGRKQLSLEKAIELDLEYVDRQNLWLDLWILARTPLAMLRFREAN